MQSERKPIIPGEVIRCHEFYKKISLPVEFLVGGEGSAIMSLFSLIPPLSLIYCGGPELDYLLCK